MPQDNREAEPHKWGQITEAPYHRVSKDLSVAWRYAKLNHHEGFVIEYLIEHSWTSPYVGRRSSSEVPDPLPVRLSATEIADDFGLARPRVSLAISSLAACRLILETPGGHLINKQAPEWLDADGAPRLTPRQLARCIKAARQERYRRVTAGVTQGERKVLPKGNADFDGALPKGNEKCYPRVTESVTQGERENRPPLEPPIGERAPEELRRIKIQEEGLEDAGARKSRQLDSQAEYGDDATFGRIREIVEQAAPNHAGTLPWRLWLASGYRPRLIEKAVKMALVSSDGKRPWPYALQVLEGWKVNGDPDDREPLPRLATHTAPAPRPKSEQELKRERVKAALAVEAARVNALYATEEVARG